jgi:hypothetical protein
MGMTDVYNTVFDFLTPANSAIPYLGVVYKALPKVQNEAELFEFVPPGTGVGALIYIFITARNETRIAYGGEHSGRKFVPYTVSLLCVMKSDLERADDGQEAFNVFIDGLVDRIRSNRNAGNPNYVFEWGEGGLHAGPDIDIQFPVPRTSRGGVMVFQAVCKVTTIEIDVT